MCPAALRGFSAHSPLSDVRRYSAVRSFIVIATLLAGILALPGIALGAYSAGPDIQFTGPESTPFDWTTQRCDDYHIPDLGVRAFRDAGGREQLLISHSSFANPKKNRPDLGGARRMTGSDLGNLTVDCTQTMLSDRTFSPSSFNNREWIAAPYSTDGQKVYSLVYDEFYGWDDPTPNRDPSDDLCFDMSGTYQPECHYSGLTLGTSTNRGDSFGRANPFLAGLPYQYVKPSGPSDYRLAIGYQDPSNIVRNPADGYYYATFTTNKYPRTGTVVQQPGTCVMRAQNLADPSSWRAWGDGNGDGVDDWNVQFVNPYPTEPANKAQHVCKPVLLPPMGDSLTFNRYFQRWMVTGYKVVGSNDIDVYYALSTSPNDLTQWETPRLLAAADMIFNCNVGDTNPILYPAALDHNSTTRNFETTGQSFYLYFTRFNQAVCDPQSHSWTFPTVPGVTRPALDRDLVRVPVKFTRKPAGDRLATLEQGTLTGNDSSYDSTSSSWFALVTWNTPGYPGYGEGAPNYAQATAYGSASTPGYGTLNTSWGTGTDAWYGSAFYFPSDFTTTNGNVDFMRWESPSGGHYGGIVLRSDNKLHLVRGTDGGAEATLGSAFDLPTGRWIWLEVHQKFAKDVAGSPISEVYLDGTPVTSSIDPNTNGDSISRVNFGYVKNDPATSYILVDRSSVSLNERGAFGAPPTPSGFTGSEGDGTVNMSWQGSAPSGGGFRVYRQNPDGTWSVRFVGTSNTQSDTQVTNCTKYHYRVSAYDAQGRESNISEPLELMPRSSTGCP